MINPEVLDLNAIVIDMEKLLRRTIGENVHLETRLAPDLPCTTGDEGQIEQILMNLAVNARDAMSDGGTLRIKTASYEADADDARQHGISVGQHVRLTVSDTGCGMPPDVAVRAFEPFFTTKAKGEGTGLGLATVYGIVTHAGGSVVISSQPVHGTTVEVILPATHDIAAGLPDAPLGRPLASGRRTILLVEDEEVVRETTRRILVGSGYAVMAASSAEEALCIADEHVGELALLLTDVVMPGRSGRELASDLSRMRPRTKVLYMSGFTSDVAGLHAASAHGLNLIEKPFESDALLRRVHAVLDSG